MTSRNENTESHLARSSSPVLVAAVLVVVGAVVVLLATTRVGNELGWNMFASTIVSLVGILFAVSLAFKRSSRARFAITTAVWIFLAVGLTCFFVLTPVGRRLWVGVLGSLGALAIVSIVAVWTRRNDSVRYLMVLAAMEADSLYKYAALRPAAAIGLFLKAAPWRWRLVPILAVAVVALVIIGVKLLFPGPHLVLLPRVMEFCRGIDSHTLRIESSSRRNDLDWTLTIPEDVRNLLRVEDTELAGRTPATVHVSVARDALGCEEREIRVAANSSEAPRTHFLVRIDNTMEPAIPQGDITFDVREDLKVLPIENLGEGRLCFEYTGIGNSTLTSTDGDTLGRFIEVTPETLECGPASSSTRSIEIRVHREHLPRRDVSYVARFEYTTHCCGSDVKEEAFRIIEVQHPLPVIEIGSEVPVMFNPQSTIDNIVVVTFVNSGRVYAPWRFSEDSLEAAPWITEISDTHGNLSVGEDVEVRIGFDPCMLPPTVKRHDLKIIVGSRETPLCVPCDVGPTEEPVIRLGLSQHAGSTTEADPLQLEIGSKATGHLWISNSGCGMLDWHAKWEDVPKADWISPDDNTPIWIESVTRMSGKCRAGDDPEQVSIVVNRESLPRGHREATLRFSQSDAGSISKTVRVCIDIEPELSVSDTNLSFGCFRDFDILTIRNKGAGTLFWRISQPDVPWLSAYPMEGSCDSGPHSSNEVTIAVHRDEFKELEETTTLRVIPTAGGTEQQVDVSVHNRQNWTFETSIFIPWAWIDGALQSGLGGALSVSWPELRLGLVGSTAGTESKWRSEVYAVFALPSYPVLVEPSCALSLAGGIGGTTLHERRGSDQSLDHSIAIVGLSELETKLCSWSLPRQAQLLFSIRVGLRYLLPEMQWQLRFGIGLHAKVRNL